jgi:hypothetical protein
MTTMQERADYFANRCQQLTRQVAWYKSRRIPKSTAAELAKYVRYRTSEKGHARTERYNRGEAGQVAARRYRDTGVPYQRRLRARIRDNRNVLAQLTAKLADLQCT